MNEDEMINKILEYKSNIREMFDSYRWNDVIFLLHPKWKKILKTHLCEIPYNQKDSSQFYIPSHYIFGTLVHFMKHNEDEDKITVEFKI